MSVGSTHLGGPHSYISISYIKLLTQEIIGSTHSSGFGMRNEQANASATSMMPPTIDII
ncbi:hypothetical protein GSD1FS_1011 [Bifidobacterium sp. GSD1FS]|uniref:Uncharacterized protein n=1 Tax=Bifidobacterium canis TaxID=2610880 RepID=A0A7K1J4U5_9BIFI|nr:hypothetical protein [Bifidobacterium canis]